MERGSIGGIERAQQRLSEHVVDMLRKRGTGLGDFHWYEYQDGEAMYELRMRSPDGRFASARFSARELTGYGGSEKVGIDERLRRMILRLEGWSV
mgnify:CR=1 FL=1